MSFLPKIPACTTPSPAVTFHLAWNSRTAGQSRLTDWESLISGLSEDDVRFLWVYLETMPTAYPSKWVKSNAKELIERAKKNPVISGIPYTADDKEVAVIASEPPCSVIEPEWVSSDRAFYSDFVQRLHDKYAVHSNGKAYAASRLYTALPTANAFLATWYTEIRKMGSGSTRSVRNNRDFFIQFIAAYAATAGLNRDTVNTVICECLV